MQHKIARLFTFVSQASSGCFVAELPHALAQVTVACSRDPAVCESVAEHLDALLKLVVLYTSGMTADTTAQANCYHLLATLLQSSLHFSPTRLWRYFSILVDAACSQLEARGTAAASRPTEDYLVQAIGALSGRLFRRRWLCTDVLVYTSLLRSRKCSPATAAVVASADPTRDEDDGDEDEDGSSDSDGYDDSGDEGSSSDSESSDHKEADRGAAGVSESKGETRSSAAAVGMGTSTAPSEESTSSSSGDAEPRIPSPADCLLRLPRGQARGGGATRGCLRSCSALAALLRRVLPRAAAACGPGVLAAMDAAAAASVVAPLPGTLAPPPASTLALRCLVDLATGEPRHSNALGYQIMQCTAPLCIGLRARAATFALAVVGCELALWVSAAPVDSNAAIVRCSTL
jgi:hypothetical protein